MALQVLKFSFGPEKNYTPFDPNWFHSGVVGSGDMEVLMEHCAQDGKVDVKVVTPVVGFEINDNNATPFIVHMRLRQALIEAKGEEA